MERGQFAQWTECVGGTGYGNHWIVSVVCIFASLSTCDTRSQFFLNLMRIGLAYFGWVSFRTEYPTSFFLTTEIDMIIPDLDCGYEGMMVGISFYFRAGVIISVWQSSVEEGRESDWNS